jgi:hypothetical protein
MFTIGVPSKDQRRAHDVLTRNRSDYIEFDSYQQDDGFYVFSFDIDYDGFKDIVITLKNNGVTTIGADEQLSERKIMKLTDLLNEQPGYNEEQPNRMESADDIIAKLKDILEIWEKKEYKDDKDRWENYYLDIEELVEDYEENQSIDRPDTSLQERKLKKLIQNIIKEWRK